MLSNSTDVSKSSIRHSTDSISYGSEIKKTHNSTGSIGTENYRRFLPSISGIKINGSATSTHTPSANSTTAALAVKMVKKTVNRKDSLLKRKVTKSQRKEKRATKTLGIVVGK